MDQTQAIAELNQKIDGLSAQVAFLAEHAQQQQLRQREWDELKADLTPVASDMYTVAVEHLAEIEPHVQLEDLLNLAKRLARNTRNLENMLDQLESLSDLLQDLSPILQDAFLSAVTALDAMERKGYFSALKEGGYVLDNVVAAFGPEDVRHLGDNIVTILNTVKEMTQPEIMSTVQNLTQRVRLVEERPQALPTSMFALLRQLRDPDVRRGLGVTLEMLKAVGAGQASNGQAQHPGSN